MTHTYSPQDIEQLSAYLDGQISIREKTLLELRLRDEPELQTELEGLAHTHLMLRSLPRRQAPRNFTLTPAMVSQRHALNLFPTFRLASALAAVLLVITFASDLVLGTGVFTNTPMAASSLQSSQQVESGPRNSAAPALAPGIITWGTPTSEPYANGMGDGGGGLTQSQPQAIQANDTSATTNLPEASETPALSAPLNPEPTETPSPTPGANITMGSVQGLSTSTPTPTETASPTPTAIPPTPTETETAVPTATETQAPTQAGPLAIGKAPNNPILGVQPPSPERQSVVAPTETVANPSPSPHGALRLIEILLAGLVIISGLLAYFFHRKESF